MVAAASSSCWRVTRDCSSRCAGEGSAFAGTAGGSGDGASTLDGAVAAGSAILAVVSADDAADGTSAESARADPQRTKTRAM